MSPALARTFRPGSPRVPLAESGSCFRSSSPRRGSCRIRRAISVHDLLRPVLTPVGLPGMQPGYGVLYPRAAVRTAPTPGELAFQAPQPPPLPHGQAGSVQQFAGGQCRGYRHAPVDAYGLAVTRCGNGAGTAAKATCQRLARSMVTRYDFAPAVPCETSGTAPTQLWVPRPAPIFRHTAHLPRLRGPTIRNPSLRPGLPPRGPPSRVFRVQGSCHGLGEVSQRLLLHRLGALREPRVLCPRRGELPALLQVARRPRAPGRQCECCSTARFHTYRAWPQWFRSMPPGRASGAADTGTYEHTIGDH